jgi:hypothetical protein
MDMSRAIAPLLDALERAAAEGASEPAQRDAMIAAARLADLARDRPDNCAALVADARVVPALAAAICSRHADGAVVEAAMAAAGDLIEGCPDAAVFELLEALVRLGVFEAAADFVDEQGHYGGAAGFLVDILHRFAT